MRGIKITIQTLGISMALMVFLFATGCGGDADTSTATITAESENVNPDETDPMKNKGIGPVTSVTLSDPIDESVVIKGKTVFEEKCSACHKIEERYVGPALGGITERRTPEWIMNMIMNPEEMTKKDPIAKALLAEYLTQMVFQDVTQDEALAMVEYFRSFDNNNN